MHVVIKQIAVFQSWLLVANLRYRPHASWELKVALKWLQPLQICSLPS